MKASYYNKFGELDNITTGTLDKPEPGEGEVLVQIKAAGVNPVDAAAAKGMLKDAIPSGFPSIPGWDMAGIVKK
jgi:NADPH:quinone reductase-like Zn-dependent oxidoreductase